MIEERKVISQLVIVKELVRIVVLWDIKRKNALKDPEKQVQNLIFEI